MITEERLATAPQIVPQTSGRMLEGKVAVITGAGVAGGIGAVCAEVFVAEGARVLAADISGGQDATAAALGDAARAARADVTDEDDVEALFARAIAEFDHVDILVNVAGNPGGRRGEEITVEEYRSLTSVHLLGTTLTNKHAVRAMLPRGKGAIVNFSSAASLNVDPVVSPAYSAAKAGVNAITKSVAAQYGAHGIRANAVAPGFTLSTKNHAVPEAIMSRLASRAALGRGGRPDEQAHVAAFLASDRASFVTGVVVPVDGGWSIQLA